MKITPIHLEELKNAMLLLENPGIAAKITDFIGTPIEKAMEFLPESWNEKIGEITSAALLKAADAAVFTMKDTPKIPASNWWHKISSATSGAIGGFFGLPALAIELPVSTTIILRSISDIARSEGESISHPATKLACLEVFALGGKSKSDNATESGYFMVRAALAKSVSEAIQFATTRSIAEEGAPALIRLIINIAQKFSIQVTQKVAVQAVPAIGAFSGALINTIFIDHFQDMAKGHFVVRRLERIYGGELIESTYKEILEKEMG